MTYLFRSFHILYSFLIIFVVTWVFIRSTNQKIISFSIFWRNVLTIHRSVFYFFFFFFFKKKIFFFFFVFFFFFFFFFLIADTILSRSNHKINLWNKHIAPISLFLGRKIPNPLSFLISIEQAVQWNNNSFFFHK